MKGEARAGGPAGLVAPRALGGLRDGHRGQGGQARGILRRLDPEGGHEAGRTHLFQPSAEALHLVDHHLEGAARLRRRLRPRGERQARAEEREVPPLPAQAGDGRRGGRGRDHRRGALARGRLLRAFRPQLVTLEAIAQRVARDSEKLGGAREVALRLLERLDEPPALQARDRVLQRSGSSGAAVATAAVSERPSIAAVTRAPSVRRATRSITFDSSRTFPGQA